MSHGSTATEYGLLLGLVAFLSLSAALVSFDGLVRVLSTSVERNTQQDEVFVANRGGSPALSVSPLVFDVLSASSSGVSPSTWITTLPLNISTRAHSLDVEVLGSSTAGVSGDSGTAPSSWGRTWSGVPGSSLKVSVLTPAVAGESFSVPVRVVGHFEDGTSQEVVVYASGVTSLPNRPDPFVLGDVDDLELDTWAVSPVVVASGLMDGSSVSASVDSAHPALLQVNGGGWVSSSTVSNGDVVRVRVRTASSPNVLRSAVLFIADVSATFSATTAPPSVSVDFVFPDVVLSATDTWTTVVNSAYRDLRAFTGNEWNPGGLFSLRGPNNPRLTQNVFGSRVRGGSIIAVDPPVHGETITVFLEIENHATRQVSVGSFTVSREPIPDVVLPVIPDVTVGWSGSHQSATLCHPTFQNFERPFSISGSSGANARLLQQPVSGSRTQGVLRGCFAVSFDNPEPGQGPWSILVTVDGTSRQFRVFRN